MLPRYDEFFGFAQKRHQIYLDRKAGKPWPWTDDPILRDNYFTNVYRELDKTTVWFREHVREDMNIYHPEWLLPATLIFRWFNRIDMGEIIFSSPELIDRACIFERYMHSKCWDTPGWLRNEIFRVKPKGPYVNGAYIIKAENGMDKLAGVCHCIDMFMSCANWEEWTKYLDYVCGGDVTLQESWSWLKSQYYIGPFTAYEIVCDLRYTKLHYRASDIMTWANPGPGAMRGLGRLYCDDPNAKLGRLGSIDLMRDLLLRSKMHWPVMFSEYHQTTWPPWEMREVEHTLCEFDKYERVRLGQGRSKRRYGPGAEPKFLRPT